MRNRKSTLIAHLGFIWGVRTVFFLCLTFIIGPKTSYATPSEPGACILVDKKTNQLYLAHYLGGRIVIEKSYHATIGKVLGDKFVRDDLKTPEGIYFLTAKELPPALPPKYGAMAFDVDYPNPVDRFEHKTGYGIMIHGTNEPRRLQKNLDSRGCIVVDNDEVRALSSEIDVGLTPVLVFPELSDAYLKPGNDPELRQFFTNWIRAWETKDLSRYIASYHSHFEAQGKDLSSWKAFKASLNRKYETIEVGPTEVRYFKHPKYSVVMFVENYRSKLKDWTWGHRSRGTKILYVSREDGRLKILTEIFTPAIEPQIQAVLATAKPAPGEAH